MLHLLRLALLLCLLAAPVAASETDLADTVDRAMAQARKEGATMRLPVNRHQEEARKAAQETIKEFHSVQFQERLQCEQKEIREGILPDALTRRNEAGPVPGRLARDERVYLFISSSMTDETVHAYLATVARAEEPNLLVLMRGLAPDEREAYLLRITRKDLGCRDQLRKDNPEPCEGFEIPILLKPSLFAKFEITQVPALVYERGDEAWRITGDAALRYLLERINREAHGRGLEELITTF